MRTKPQNRANHNDHHDNIELQYSLSFELYQYAELVKLVSNDMQKLLQMPLSKASKSIAIKELSRILRDNIPDLADE
jgi:hypothetical protein